MPIDFPTHKEIVSRNRAEVAANLPGADPTIFGSFVRAFADSQAGRAYDITLLQQQMLAEFFPQTAIIFLERWAGYEGLTRQPATKSTGPATITGAVAGVVPIGTQWRTPESGLFTTTTEGTISAQSISVSTITRVGSAATVTTASDHGMAPGITVAISGAVETDYNGSFEIIVSAADKFTYTVPGAPTTPATGTILAGFDGATINLESLDTGQAINLENGAQLTLVTPISGVDAGATVQFDEVAGGTDTENDDNLRVRIFQSRANPVANFNVAAIEKVVRTIAGNTRVKVKRITPYIGAVTVLFVRDGEANIIPTATDAQNVEDAVVALSQATTDVADIFITAPTPVSTNYTFTAISPDTSTMRAAIEANLIAFYRDEVTFETNIIEDKYRAAIINTVDIDTGEALVSFTLSGPSGDITVTTDEIGVLGQVIMP